MIMKAKNLLFILSDQHARRFSGCYGHPLVKTPHLDALARRGTRFTQAYTPAPICVPARASLATGRYVHEIGYWDNATPYLGTPDSWGHRLQRNGHRVLSIGKLHYRNSTDDVGFDEERLAMHVIDGEGMLFSLIRDPIPSQKKFRMMVEDSGPGTSNYTRYDGDITAEAERWLTTESAQSNGKPWALFVSLVCPHPPFISPPEFYDLYDRQQIPMPKSYLPGQRPSHPALEDFRRFFCVENPFDEETLHRVQAAYFGLTSYLDHNIGRILAALEKAGLSENTRIIYTSDHGESLGQKGMFSKCNFFEESVGIPMIIAGPDIRSNHVVDTPVSLIDCFPTILQGVGAPFAADDNDLPGYSLFDIAEGLKPDRFILSEHHSVGAKSAIFMIRNGKFKYVYHHHLEPMLFDLENDSEELVDLAQDVAYRSIRYNCHTALLSMLDPATVDARAKNSQHRRVVAAGGIEAIMAKGTPGHTPAPGEIPVYVR